MASTCRLYSLADIQEATKNFDDGLLIGHGGFGKVYRGDIVDETGSVAFKRLDSMSDQGAPEFRAEIEVLSKLRHAHLVSLLGCCEEGKEMILVYEYMPNGTLYHHLHNGDGDHTHLSWMQRLKIGIGAARGLDYLHTGVGTKHGIIHRDVKSSNILLDQDWAAKISDFGLAKLCPINQLSSYVRTDGIKGTFGYLDPEIFMTGKFTRKTDVFAFGVVLFELLSGRRAVLPEGDEDLSLARWAQNCVKGRKLDQIVAAEIRSTLSPKCLKEFVQIGYRCLQSVPKDRPTMSEVVATLQLSLALQEKFESSAKPSAAAAGIFRLTWKMPTYIFPKKKDNSAGGTVADFLSDYERKNATTNFRNATFNDLHGEQVAAGWPVWLSAVAGEAINGWIPLRADTYEKMDKIGEGSSSVVYKARDIMSGKIVALKKVRFDHLEPESVKFMAREILILRRLDHPNVVKLEGLITSRMSSSLYLVFEYVDHDLRRLDAITFTEPQVKCYMHQLLCGLEYCHNRCVLHRDIKRSNLLINNDGCLKIADFGSASFFDPNHKQPMTSRVVTLWYRPPELLLGATDYGVGIDLWSAGCILAELLAGNPIMPGRTEVEQLHKIFKLCGSPSDDYWKKSKLPHATVFKPQQPYKRCIAEIFKNFPPSSLPLIDTLLAIDPAQRQTTTAALRSEFFMTKPYACDPSSLPKYPPANKEDTSP